MQDYIQHRQKRNPNTGEPPARALRGITKQAAGLRALLDARFGYEPSPFRRRLFARTAKRLAAVAILALAWAAAAATPLANPKTFYALGQIESGANDRAIGGVGEVSRYQVRPELWRRYARPGELPRREADARRVVQRIMAERLAALGRPATPVEFYVLWNAPAQLRGRISPVVLERATRFANLANS